MGVDPKAPKYTLENKIPTLVEFVRDQYASWCAVHLQWSADQLKNISKFTEFANMPLDEIKPQRLRNSVLNHLKYRHTPSTAYQNYAVL